MGRMMETVRRTFQLAHVMRARGPGGARAGDADDATERVLRYLAKVTDRAGDHPRHRRPRRLAPARPARRHRALGAGLLRGQAGARPQERRAPRGGRSARATRPSKAPSRPATDRSGAGSGRAAASLSTTFVSGLGRAIAGAGRAWSIGDGGPRDAWPHPFVARPEPRTAADRGRRPRRHRARWTASPLAIDPVTEVPLSRRYLLR